MHGLPEALHAVLGGLLPLPLLRLLRRCCARRFAYIRAISAFRMPWGELIRAPLDPPWGCWGSAEDASSGSC